MRLVFVNLNGFGCFGGNFGLSLCFSQSIENQNANWIEIGIQSCFEISKLFSFFHNFRKQVQKVPLCSIASQFCLLFKIPKPPWTSEEDGRKGEGEAQQNLFAIERLCLQPFLHIANISLLFYLQLSGKVHNKSASLPLRGRSSFR